MLKFRFGLIIFLLAIYPSGVVAQTISGLIIPENLYGTIKLPISVISPSHDETLSYNELAVFVKNESDNDVNNAIQGRHTQEGNYLVFKPYFPFENGMTYVVRIKNGHAENDYKYHSFQVGEQQKVASAKVINIYPSTRQLPENCLRFYIYFNTPMKKGEALKHIQLKDAAGKVDDHAFMEFKQELWSANGKRLTLLLDPGRIKRGVATNVLRGPALLKGKYYQLSISETWQDVYGQPLAENITKEIEVTTAYRHQIKVNEWGIKQPKVNSHDAVVIQFDRIMDHALIQSMIQLVNAQKNRVLGYWEILEQEQSLQFIPEQKWQQGKYQIVIDPRLEDVAGNNLHNLLDHRKMDMDTDHRDFRIDFNSL